MGLNLNTIYNTPRDIRTSMRLTGSRKGSFSLNMIDEASIIYKETVKEAFYDFSVLALNESFDVKNILSGVVKFLKNIITALINLIKKIVDIIRKAISDLSNMIKGNIKIILNSKKDNNYIDILDKILKEKDIKIKMCDIDNIAGLDRVVSKDSNKKGELILRDDLSGMKELTGLLYAFTNSYRFMPNDISGYSVKTAFNDIVDLCNRISPEEHMKNVCDMVLEDIYGNIDARISKEVSNGRKLSKYIDELNVKNFGSRDVETKSLDIDLYNKCKKIIDSDTFKNAKSNIEAIDDSKYMIDDINYFCNEIMDLIYKISNNISNMPPLYGVDSREVNTVFGMVADTFRYYTSFVADIALSNQKAILYKISRFKDIYTEAGYCAKVVEQCDKLVKDAGNKPKNESFNIDGKSFDNVLENRFNENIEKLFNIAESEYIDRKFGVLFESILLEDGEKKTGVLGIFEAIKAFFGKVAEIFKKLFTGENSAVEKAIHGSPEEVAAGKDRVRIFGVMKDKVQHNDEVAKITTTDTVFYDPAKVDAFEQKLGTLDIDNIFPANTAELFSSNYIGKFSKDIYAAMNETGGETKLIIKYLKDMGINVNDNDEKINITQVLLDNFTSHSTGDNPENIKDDDLDGVKEYFDKFMNNGSALKNLEQKVVTTLEKISNTDYSNFDVNSLDQNTIETLKQVFGDDENTTAQGEAMMSFKSYSALQNILEAIQTNGAGGDSSGNNNSGNLKLVTRYLNALKTMAKAKIKIIQAYVNAKTKMANDSYNLFDTIAKIVFKDDYNAAIGSGNNTNAPKPNNPNDAQQNQNNNEKK